MSECRQPRVTLRIRSGSANHKLEVFRAAEFTERITAGQTVKDKKGRHKLRVRLDGVWMHDRKTMVTFDQLSDMLVDLFDSAVNKNEPEKAIRSVLSSEI